MSFVLPDGATDEMRRFAEGLEELYPPLSNLQIMRRLILGHKGETWEQLSVEHLRKRDAAWRERFGKRAGE